MISLSIGWICPKAKDRGLEGAGLSEAKTNGVLGDSTGKWTGVSSAT
jgi:hypothetical protein